MIDDWTKKNILPLGDMEAWHQYQAGESGHEIIYDYSGKGRHISCTVGNEPVLTSAVLNGRPAWYFNGSRTPLKYTGALTARHIFLVCAADEAVFTGYRGILSGATAGDVLTGDTGTDEFFDFGYTAFGSYEYRKANRIFTESTQKAPMSANFKLIEIKYPPGITMDGIQVGQQKTLTDRKFKGWFVEQLIYSQEKAAKERESIYQYFAMKFRLWEEYDATRLIFPFPHDRARSSERGREHYLSEPYSGQEKALVRGQMRRSFELPFALRPQEEYEAAEAFHALHYPIAPFALRDHRFSPERISIVKTASPIREQGGDVSFRFNYAFDAIEVQ